MTETDTAAPKPAPIPFVLPPSCFANASKMLKAVPLQYPIEFGGRTWNSISLRRLSVEQITSYQENTLANEAANPEFRGQIPIFVDSDGNSIPDNLLLKLDQDDFDKLNEEAYLFLPLRYRSREKTESENTDSTRSTGEITSTQASV